MNRRAPRQTGRYAMPARRPRGFTLVEVLIAVALTAILVTLLFSALGTYLRASHAVTGVVEREDRYYAAAFFLRRQLRELLPFSTLSAGEEVIFSGESQRLRYIGRLPSHRAPGGTFINELRVEKQDAQQALVLYYTPLPPVAELTDADIGGLEQAGDRILLGELDEAGFAYCRADDCALDGEWRETWDNADGLPELVRLSLAQSGDEPEQLIFRVAAASAVSPDAAGPARTADEDVPDPPAVPRAGDVPQGASGSARL